MGLEVLPEANPQSAALLEHADRLPGLRPLTAIDWENTDGHVEHYTFLGVVGSGLSEM